MRIFEYVCFEGAYSGLQHLHCFAKAEIKSDFKCVFTVISKKLAILFIHNFTVL